jgi:ABC-2 type transport system permease protein
MKSFAEEFSSGTIELLKTKPISNWQIVFSKFSASILLIIIALLPTFFYVYTISILGNPIGNLDFGPVIGSYFGLLFLIFCYTSIGLFTSVISKNQIIAFILNVSLAFLLFYGFDIIVNLMDSDFALEQLGMHSHYEGISRGIIDSRDLIYFASVTIFFLFLTKTHLEHE